MITSHTFFKQIFNFSLLLIVSAVLFSSIYAAGEVDPTFDTAVQESITGSVETIVVQPDGKLLVGGNFTVANNSARSNIARFNADGTVDQTFNPPDFYKGTSNGIYVLKESFIYAIAAQADGKILVGGNFNRIGINFTQQGVVRLNTDGSLDTTFVPPAFDGGQIRAIVYDIKIQTNNQILIGGEFRTSGVVRSNFARLNTDGSLDTAFNPFSFVPGAIATILTFVIQPDGKIIYPGGSGEIRRINSDGSPDNSFSTATLANGNGGANKILLQPDGKIIVGGIFSSVNNFTQNNITRLNSDGTLDVSFNVNGTGAGQRIKSIALLPDGKITIVGLFTTYNSVQRMKNARLNSDGTLDTTFNYNPGSTAIINDVKSLGDGRVIIGGIDSSGNWSKLSRLNSDGSLDPTFVGRIYHKGIVYTVYAQPDGKVLVGGLFQRINGVVRSNFARLNQDGSVDAGFVADTMNPNTLNGRVLSIALQLDGKILISGDFSTVNGVIRQGLARLNTDGSVDTSFIATAGGGNKIVVLPNDKILATGGVRRLNSNGSIDPTFSQPTADSVIFALEVQADGKIVIGGGFTQINGTPRGRIARLNADGTLDTTFNPPFGANNSVLDLAIQSDGRIVIGGIFTGVNGVTNRRYLARLNSDGSLDTSFNPTLDDWVYAVEKQSDDKILIGGTFGLLYGIAPYDIARLNQDGSFDASFAGPGANEPVRSIFVQTDNKILIGGEFSRVNGISRVGVARLLNNSASARTLFDFDGDGKADIAVFRPSNGFWYVARSTGIPSQNFDATQFGISTDKIAPADYDGDGRTDIAVWRESSVAYFYVLQGQTNTLRFEQFGQTGDVPIPGDWDGDGKADLAVYRSGAPSLFIYRPSGAPGVDFRIIYFGASGDKPAVGDFDGDGKQDAAVFRPSTGIWYVKRSSDDQLYAIQFGNSADNIVPADYDGDGKTDVAVFRPSNGVWYLQQTTAGFTGVQFGQVGDKPSPADYDGDRKADIAVFRDGIWYLQRSTAGFTGVQFGGTGDQPVPNAYVQ